MLREEEIHTICSENAFQRGKWIYQNNKIINLRVRKDHASDRAYIQGMVEGNYGFYHTVCLTMNFHERPFLLDASCNCYDSAKKSGICCHGAALLLSVKNLEPLSSLPEYISDSVAKVPEERISPPDTSFVQETVPVEADGSMISTLLSNVSAVPSDKSAEETVEVPDSFTGEPRSMEILFGSEISRELSFIEDGEQEELPSGSEKSSTDSVFWYPNDTAKVFHTNIGIIGTMGTGKTQFTKSLITQLYCQQHNNYDGHPLGILIFDYKGDYNNSKPDFVDAVHPRIFQPYKLPFNPLALSTGGYFRPLLPVHVANTFKDTISRVFRLGAKQQASLFRCIMQAYEKMGIFADDPATWNRPAPTFDMVYDIYNQNREIPKTDSLAAAMQKLSRDQFHIFEDNSYKTEPLLDLLRGVVVMDLHSYDPDIQSLVVAITLDQFYSQMQATGSSCTSGALRQLTRLILVDEADNFMKEEFPALKKIMKEGREFGVGTILSTQFLEHFTAGDDDYSKYILTWVVHNVSDLKKSDIEYIFKLQQKTNKSQILYNAIKGLDKHCSVVKIGNDDPVIIRDHSFWELYSRDREQLQ